ncbi:hypothetical protein LTR95_004056 [Oleoguttula sp. CCFEE 5521]
MELHEPEWITGDSRHHNAFETLVAYVHSTCTDAADWSHLLDTTIATLLSLGTENPTAQEYKLDSHVLCVIVLTLAKQLDPATTAHDRLVELVLTIRNMPMPLTVVQTIDEYDRNNEVHLELTPFIGAYSDFERDAPLHPPLEDRPTTPIHPTRAPWRLLHSQCLRSSEWASVNAFVAKIHTAEPEIPKLDIRGLFAMIEALEESLTGPQLETILPAASVWIIYAGPALKANNVPYVCYPTESERMPWSRGELWKGRHAFSEERWQFWLQRFREIAEREDVSNAVRKAALEAVETGSRA